MTSGAEAKSLTDESISVEMPVPDLAQIVPKKGWIADYHELMAGATDAPGIFHILVGLGMVAGACGNRVKIPDVAGVRFLNLYICLLASAGDGRKSTCVKPAERIFSDRERWGKPMLLANDFSMEAQAQEFIDNPERLIISSEFKATFDVFSGRDYNKGAISRLVSLYDSDPIDVSRVGRDVTRAPEIALTIIGASTAEWFLQALNPAQYEAGLWGRFLICYAKRSEFNQQPVFVGDDIDDFGLILRNKTKDFDGEKVDFSQVTREKDRFAQVTQDIRDEIGQDPKGQLLIGGVARMPMYASKIATLLAISERWEPKPTPEDFWRATTLVEYLFACQKYVVEYELALSPIEKKRNDLKKTIFGHPGLTKTELTRKSQSLDQRTRGQLLAELEEAKFIKVTEDKAVTKPIRQYWPYTHVITSKKLTVLEVS